jgi:hypothetical protein
VQLRQVTLGHDFGDTVQILSGVTASDAVIANPSDSLTAGARVAVNNATTPSNPPTASGTPSADPATTAAMAQRK